MHYYVKDDICLADRKALIIDERFLRVEFVCLI